MQLKKVSIPKLIFIILVTTSLVTVLARYKSETTSNDSVQVAFPTINLSSNQILEVDVNPEMEEKQFIFSVSNKEDKRSEVTMSYNIEIESLNNLPLEFELYTYENNTKGTKNLLKQNGRVTDYINLGIDEDKTETYMLDIRWNENEKDYRYSQTLDYVKIFVNGLQVD